MKIEELKEFAQENFGVAIKHQVVRSEPSPGEAVLLTIRNADQVVKKICCRADLIQRSQKKTSRRRAR